MRVCFLFLLYTVLFSVAVRSETAAPPSLIVLQLPGLTEANGSGAYANYYNALQMEGMIAKWKQSTPLRAHHSFIEKENGCIAPASLDLLDKYSQVHSDFVIASSFNKAQGVVMTAANPPSAVETKPIMGTVGFGIQHGVKAGTYRVQAIPDYMRLLRLIVEDRLDAAYVVYPDVVHYPEAERSLASFKGKSQVVWEGTDGVLCWKDYKVVVDQMSIMTNVWRRDGTLKEMLGKYFVE